MEPLKHECGVAMIRLLKPLEYYKQRYGTYCYALSKLYLMMEKQHNRGQEGAGIGVVKLHTEPGHEYVFRERALGAGAIQQIFDTIRPALDSSGVESLPADQVEREVPFVGEIYMGHLRYSTTGKSGISYVHPFLRRNNWRSRNLLLCGNFNMTNVDRIFSDVVSTGQHPRIYSDTVVLLEQLGHALDHANHEVYRAARHRLQGTELTRHIEDNLDIPEVLRAASPTWDGGFVICGATGSGDMFAMRDAAGIRPAFYYADDEVVVVASERPVIQTVMNVRRSDVRELEPGQSLIVSKSGRLTLHRILPQAANARCSFERIYFSRGSDADIYQERKALGRNLVGQILDAVGHDIDHTVFSFIPNTAEVAFYGMMEGLNAYLDDIKSQAILEAQQQGTLTPETVARIMSHKVRIEKIAIKDIKLRTFIAEGAARDELAAHVYDVTYGCVADGVDSLVVIDDSIVRGTTLRQSILRILDRLRPRKIVVVSSSPQVRYPDCYGIDMSRMAEFCAFRAAVELIHRRGMDSLLDDTYRRCVEMESRPDSLQANCVKAIYAPFTDREIAAQIAEMLTPSDVDADVEIIYQSIDGLHRSIPDHPGDWYFSGDYPTPGGFRAVNRAYINFYEGNTDRR
ncbi:MAG: amidophosphoribosyltransferase [Paramuribaculum sp.]|nr:amidophosphoribosyltransferase [Paramuribaculum sp.]MDE5920759.1 amidophosphoribosyltransferase [Paramuribaculum sp.]